MINLLPPELKKSYRYGASNVALVRWVVAGIVSLAGLGVIGTYGWLTLHQDIDKYNSQINTTQSTLKLQKQKETYAQVQDISNNFRLVVQVLSKEVLFSKLLSQMATAMPSGSYLTDLTIGKTTGAIDITAQTVDQQTATQVQVNLSDPSNQIFAKADIVNITCAAKNAKDPTHPCVVNIRALFAQKNPFLFINQKAGA
ncbi:MAG TPA: hypothetical protein VFI84_00055 [Candidatus Saccharimonadales bacterium]|nr:hypothetical protein [Candidatus Saccharimonadales bacterium]